MKLYRDCRKNAGVIDVLLVVALCYKGKYEPTINYHSINTFIIEW